MSSDKHTITGLPRGLSRAQCARYVGVGVTMFDRMVEAGLMPKPKKIAGRRVWDLWDVDKHFDDLPELDESKSDDSELVTDLI